MAEGALSIKLRCASWQQLATIYKRDLSRGTMFLKAVTPPPIGTPVHIDLAMPSATVIELTGVVQRHLDDPQRGVGVELLLAPIPTGSVWLIENALASVPPMTGISPTLNDSADLTAAERDLIRALVSEAESLKKLNPFLVLGVGYEATDAEVRAAFGELTKRYHPDRFARYESAEVRQVSAEIFILIRDAYRRLGDAAARSQLLQSLGKAASAPPPPRPTARVPAPTAHVATTTTPPALSRATPVASGAAPTRSTPTAPPGVESTTPVAAAARRATTRRPLENSPMSPPAISATYRRARPSQPATGEPLDLSALEQLIERGKLDAALAAYRQLANQHPHDRNVRAGVELCEGLRAFAARDRTEAAQRFEAALEIDPSNERAARELADMRRQATNERKGLLSRLMGKQEP
jgi:curved DNA-binding protein CbpA